MIVIACPKCMHAIRVDGEAAELQSLVGQASEFWPDKFPCYNCEEKGLSGVLVPEVDPDAYRAMDVVVLTPVETYAALHGLGIADERTCCAEVVEPLFKSTGITLHGKQLQRTTLYQVDHMTLPDGSRVYFGVSPHGVVIHRVTGKHSYAAALEKNNV